MDFDNVYSRHIFSQVGGYCFPEASEIAPTPVITKTVAAVKQGSEPEQWGPVI